MTTTGFGCVKLVLLIKPSPANSTPRITALVYRREKKIALARRVCECGFGLINVRLSFFITVPAFVRNYQQQYQLSFREVASAFLFNSCDFCLNMLVHLPFMQLSKKSRVERWQNLHSCANMQHTEVLEWRAFWQSCSTIRQ